MLEMKTLLMALSTDTIVLVVMLLLVGAYAWLESRKAAAKKQAEQAERAAAPVAVEVEPAPAASVPEAKGTAGTILLHDVPEREAAMVMAVVAYRLGKPLNQLRFKSIREVKEK